MFSSHEVLQLSECNKDFQKRCLDHGEKCIMFNQKSKSVMCATCFRESSSDARIHCTDIDTAWQHASKKMERTYKSLNDLQVNVHDELFQLKSHLDNLRHELESERRTLNNFYQVII